MLIPFIQCKLQLNSLVSSNDDNNNNDDDVDDVKGGDGDDEAILHWKGIERTEDKRMMEK